MENGYLNGSGAGQPLGVFTASDDGIGTGRDMATGNTETTFTADGLKNCKYNLTAAYRKNAKWIFHRDGIKMASKFKDGEGQYLWKPGITESDPDRLLGYPVFESEYAPSTFTSGLYVGIFGDFSYYWIADMMQLEMQRLNELYARTSQVGFIGRMWSDGMPVMANAFSRVTLA
jgi:HK97 family phage major capsid protein